jgi:hypothetical protein
VVESVVTATDTRHCVAGVDRDIQVDRTDELIGAVARLLRRGQPTTEGDRMSTQHASHHVHEHVEQPLNVVALSATLHCLTGCAIGEVLGMIIGTALGFSDWGTIALAVALAFLFGYGLTSLPLLRSGLALAAVVPIALASDTISIAIMEIVDNAIMLLIPGAMDAGLDSIGFYAALTAALIVAGAAAYPINHWLISRGKGHAVVHHHHAH